MIIGSLAGPLCAGGGFCAGSEEIVDHQRISAASYTFSAALPAMLATTASETIQMLQTTPDLLNQTRENVKAMWGQLDPRSDWMRCSSSVENPMMILVFKEEVLKAKGWGVQEQEGVLQDVVDEVWLVEFLMILLLWLNSIFHDIDLLTNFLSTVPSQRRPHHSTQKHASLNQWQRVCVGDVLAARSEDLHDIGTLEERSGEGGNHDPTCHHQNRQEPQTLSFLYKNNDGHVS